MVYCEENTFWINCASDYTVPYGTVLSWGAVQALREYDRMSSTEIRAGAYVCFSVGTSSWPSLGSPADHGIAGVIVSGAGWPYPGRPFLFVCTGALPVGYSRSG